MKVCLLLAVLVLFIFQKEFNGGHEVVYLLSPTFQFENASGKPLSEGWIEVYLAGTRTKYITFKDKSGFVKNEFQVKLNSLGSAVIFVSDVNSYDVYVYDYMGNQVMSRLNVTPSVGGEITIDGVVTVLNNTDSNISLEMTETPEHWREYEVNLSDEFKERIDDAEQNIVSALEGIIDEAEARKNKDDDLQAQIDNIKPGDAITAGDFIELKDKDDKTQINVAPTKTIRFDTTTLDVQDNEDEIIVGGKSLDNFKFRVSDNTTSKNFDGNELDFTKMKKSSTYNLGGTLVGVKNNLDGTFESTSIDIPLQYTLTYPVVDIIPTNEQVVSIGLDNEWKNSLTTKTDIPTFDVSTGGLVTTKCKDSSGNEQTVYLTTLSNQNEQHNLLERQIPNTEFHSTDITSTTLSIYKNEVKLTYDYSSNYYELEVPSGSYVYDTLGNASDSFFGAYQGSRLFKAMTIQGDDYAYDVRFVGIKGQNNTTVMTAVTKYGGNK